MYRCSVSLAATLLHPLSAVAPGFAHYEVAGLSESLNVSVTVAIVLAVARGERAKALKLDADNGDLSREARDALAARYMSLCGHFTRHERAKRTLEHNFGSLPPALELFVAPARAVFEAVRLGHKTMVYGELALHVWLICQVFGIATRARALRTARWGRDIVRLNANVGADPGDSDWRIVIEHVDSAVQSQASPVVVQLSQLQPLSDVGLLQPQFVSEALQCLFARTSSPNGRLVFSHSGTEEEIFKKNKFCKFFAAKIGIGMDCAQLRKRLELDANALTAKGTIDAACQALLARVLH